MNWRLGPAWAVGNRRAIENARAAARDLSQRRVEREDVEIFLAEWAAAAVRATGSADETKDGAARCPNPAPAGGFASRLTA